MPDSLHPIPTRSPRLYQLLPGRRYKAVDTLFDISHFRSLKTLFLNKVAAERVVGLQVRLLISPHSSPLLFLTPPPSPLPPKTTLSIPSRTSVSSWSTFICTAPSPTLACFSLDVLATMQVTTQASCAIHYHLSHLTATCPFHPQVEAERPWIHLETAVCSGNRLHTMDGAMKLLHNISTLDLSDNRISDVSLELRLEPRCRCSLPSLSTITYRKLTTPPPALSHLRKLTSLNLSYNHISSLRPLQSQAVFDALQRTLTTLNLRCNNIVTLLGIEVLFALESLDVAQNGLDELDELRCAHAPLAAFLTSSPHAPPPP